MGDPKKFRLVQSVAFINLEIKNLSARQGNNNLSGISASTRLNSQAWGIIQTCGACRSFAAAVTIRFCPGTLHLITAQLQGVLRQ